MAKLFNLYVTKKTRQPTNKIILLVLCEDKKIFLIMLAVAVANIIQESILVEVPTVIGASTSKHYTKISIY